MTSMWIIHRDDEDRVCAIVRIDETPDTGVWVEQMTGMTLELPQTVEVASFELAEDYQGKKIRLEGKEE